MTQGGYLMSGQASELERLQLQSKVWEPSGRQLLGTLPPGDGPTVASPPRVEISAPGGRKPPWCAPRTAWSR